MAQWFNPRHPIESPGNIIDPHRKRVKFARISTKVTNPSPTGNRRQRRAAARIAKKEKS